MYNQGLSYQEKNENPQSNDPWSALQNIDLTKQK